MRRVLGVDSGNSKTLALISDAEGHILGLARAAGSNHERIGFPEVERVFHRVAHEALRFLDIDERIRTNAQATPPEELIGST